METATPIVNRVAESGLITLSLEEYFPQEGQLAGVDLKQYLFKELVLREADFREAVKAANWADYDSKYVYLYCSNTAIVPMWAYMLLAAALAPFAKDVVCTTPIQAAEVFMLRQLAKLPATDYAGKRVLVKGCGERPIPEAAYVQVTQLLQPVVRSLMYGEACSNVPVFKKA